MLEMALARGPSGQLGNCKPSRWLLMHVPPRFQSPTLKLHTATGTTSFVWLQCISMLLLLLLIPPHTTCLSAWQTTMSNSAASLAACASVAEPMVDCRTCLEAFTSWLQPLEHTRRFHGSSSPRGMHTGVQSSLWRTQTPSRDSVLMT